MLNEAPTRYAEVDDLNIAYQVYGSGPVDLVYVPGLDNHVEAAWDLSGFPEWMERLARFARIKEERQTGGQCHHRPPAIGTFRMVNEWSIQYTLVASTAMWPTGPKLPARLTAGPPSTLTRKIPLSSSPQ